MSKPITLPPGHQWMEVPNMGSSLTGFDCECGASFIHDMTDDSVEYNEGEGHEEP